MTFLSDNIFGLNEYNFNLRQTGTRYEIRNAWERYLLRPGKRFGRFSPYGNSGNG